MSVAIRELIVPRHNRLVYQGQVVNIIIEVADVSLTSTLLTLGIAPTLSLYNPDGEIVIDNDVMSLIETGKYSYLYQTTSLNDMGVYTVDINASYAGLSARLTKVVVFKIIDTGLIAPVFPQFTYLAIKDQTGVVWYWSVALDNTANFTFTIPTSTNRVAVAIVEATIPYWIAVLNDSGSTRYIYPHITGEYIVSTTQPAVGLGLTGSPTWIGLDGQYFLLNVSTSDEAVMNII